MIFRNVWWEYSLISSFLEIFEIFCKRRGVKLMIFIHKVGFFLLLLGVTSPKMGGGGVRGGRWKAVGIYILSQQQFLRILKQCFNATSLSVSETLGLIDLLCCTSVTRSVMRSEVCSKYYPVITVFAHDACIVVMT